MSTHADKMAIHEDLQRRLAEAQADRVNRPEFVNGEPEWVFHERRVMLSWTNTYRLINGLPDVGIEEIERVERMACGHSDYTSKFALYCAELAMGERPTFLGYR